MDAEFYMHDVDTVKAMTCKKLAEWLSKDLYKDEAYKEDLKKLKKENIDGKLFLQLPYNTEMVRRLKLSIGGEQHLIKMAKSILNDEMKVGDEEAVLPGTSQAKTTPQQGEGNSVIRKSIPLCSTETPRPSTADTHEQKTSNGGMQKACMPPNAEWGWKDHKKLIVEFENKHLLNNWKFSDGQTMNTDTILRHANIWYRLGKGKIPLFVDARSEKDPPQIRVKFNNKGKRKSEVGRAAQKVQAPKPTMKLDLNTNCLDDGYKIHLIMHEFGHALGLLHEHQRSIFWKCIEPHTDLVVMKSHLGNRFADFEEIADSESGPNRTDYDPESIMHYWFKKEWLKNGYSDEKKVIEDRDSGFLSDKVANALLGVHKRQDLATKPSKLDIQLLQKVYGGGTSSNGAPGPAVPGKKRARVNTDGQSAHTEDVLEQTDGYDPTIVEEESELTSGGGSTIFDGETPAAKRQKLTSVPENANDRLKIHDLNDVKKRLYGVRTHWKSIGDALGIDNETLTSIQGNEKNDGDRLREMLTTWLRKASTRKRPITWSALVSALKEVDGCGDLAQEIAKRNS